MTSASPSLLISTLLLAAVLVALAWKLSGRSLLSLGFGKHLSSDSPRKQIAIKQLFVYPIKSCQAVPVSTARHTHDGLLYDRTWLIIDATTKKFCTARELPRMILIRPVIDESNGMLEIHVPPLNEGDDVRVVKTPLQPTDEALDEMEILDDIFIWGQFVNGYSVSPQADEALSEYFGKAVRLVRKGPSSRQSGPDDHRISPTLNYQDFYPITLVSTASLSHIRQSLTKAVYPDLSSSSSSSGTLQSLLSLPNVVAPKGVNKAYWTAEQLEELPITRFRPNILIESIAPPTSTSTSTSKDPQTLSLQPWEEDGFCEVEIFDKSKNQQDATPPFGTQAIGKGKVSILCMARCNRCMVPNIDPKTGVRDNHLPYKLLQQYRQVDPGGRKIGKPAVAVLGAIKDEEGKSEGILSIGDVVRVTKVTNPDTRVASKK